MAKTHLPLDPDPAVELAPLPAVDVMVTTSLFCTIEPPNARWSSSRLSSSSSRRSAAAAAGDVGVAMIVMVVLLEIVVVARNDASTVPDAEAAAGGE